MIKKIENSDLLTEEEITIINKIDDISKLDWEKPKEKIVEIKKNIKFNLLEAQKHEVFDCDDLLCHNCAYCGCIMETVGRKEVEHIAHKAKYKFFEYYPTNLVYVCSHCNGSSKKGQKDVVKNWDESNEIEYDDSTVYEQIKKFYEGLDFSIIHPKLDNPDDHIEWFDENKTIIKTHLTPKGKESIKIFELNGHHLTLQRIREHKEKEEYKNNPQIYKNILKYTKKY